MAAGQDEFQRARERYDDAREAMRENHERMREDLRFSNPAAPEQWKRQTLDDRKGRATLTLDQTNQFIQQVVNDGRMNSPSLSTIPVDSQGDVEVAAKCSGLLRHVEYRSRAHIAYDTSLEYGARIGLGWLRAVPVVVNRDKNFQEPRVFAVHDPLSCCIDGDSVEFDGSDAMCGYAESSMSEAAFKRRWPKAKVSSFETSHGWHTEKGIRVADYFEVVETKANAIEVARPGGETEVLTEDEYWDEAKRTGSKPIVLGNSTKVSRKVLWRQMSGVDFLGDPIEFPSDWIGLVPVYGSVLWIDGKRYVCGLTRRLMDGQRFHNYQMSSLAEILIKQPTAPFMAPARAIEGLEQHWEQLASGDPTYLPYNDVDDDGDPVAAPSRVAPPVFPAAYANASELGVRQMQAAVGMWNSSLGKQSNAVSGRAKIADERQGDVATFHFIDNQRRSLEHFGRILLQMTLRLIDTPRQMRILGVDDKVSSVLVDPDMQTAVRRNPSGAIEAINPNVGEYDVRVKVGPGYSTVREEMKDRLAELSRSNPALAAALTPIIVKLDDLPEADKIMRVCLALLPPQVQEAYREDDGETQLPPQVKAQVQAMQQQLQQATQMLQQMQAALQEAQAAAQGKADEVALKNRELDIKGRELDIKAAEADYKMRAEASAVANDQTAQQQLLQVVAEVSGALEQIAAAQQQLAVQVEQWHEESIELAQAHDSTADQLGQLAALVARPRVAQIEYDEAGRPSRAVGTLQ